MDLTPYVDRLRQELLAVTDAAAPEVRAAAERVTMALDPAVRMTMLELLSQAAAEITTLVPSGSVDVRPGPRRRVRRRRPTADGAVQHSRPGGTPSTRPTCQRARQTATSFGSPSGYPNRSRFGRRSSPRRAAAASTPGSSRPCAPRPASAVGHTSSSTSTSAGSGAPPTKAAPPAASSPAGSDPHVTTPPSPPGDVIAPCPRRQP